MAKKKKMPKLETPLSASIVGVFAAICFAGGIVVLAISVIALIGGTSAAFGVFLTGAAVGASALLTGALLGVLAEISKYLYFIAKNIEQFSQSDAQ